MDKYQCLKLISCQVFSPNCQKITWGHHGGCLMPPMPPQYFFLRTKIIFPIKCFFFKNKNNMGHHVPPMMSPIMGGIMRHQTLPTLCPPPTTSLTSTPHTPPPPTPPLLTPPPPPTHREKVGPQCLIFHGLLHIVYLFGRKLNGCIQNTTAECGNIATGLLLCLCWPVHFLSCLRPFDAYHH